MGNPPFFDDPFLNSARLLNHSVGRILSISNAKSREDQWGWRGCAKATINLYTKPVRSASKGAAKKWREDFHDFADDFEIPKNAKGKRKQTAKRIEWIARFLLWLHQQEDGWNVLAGIALQGLCGLRVSETLRLRWDRVDLEHGIISIDGETKNDPSRRRIPVPSLALEILKATPRCGNLVIFQYGGISSWRNALKIRSGPNDQEYVGFMDRFEVGSYIPPKDLRNTLATERKRRLWNKEVMQIYLGHSSRDVIDIHYSHLEDDEVIDLFRQEVVSKVDDLLVDFLTEWKEQTQTCAKEIAA